MGAESEIRALTDRILELEEDVGRWDQDQKAASVVRKREKTDYEATLTDYTESVDALTEAIAVLKKQAYSRSQPELLQTLLKGHLVPPKAKLALAAFLQQAQPSVEAMPDDMLFNKAPEASAYEFQSGGVIDMLVKLKDE